MVMALLAVIAGLGLLFWSADQFVEGSAGTAHHFGMPPLLVGMVVVGFGTSAPEMVVSGLSAWQGNPGIAIGNAYGSNIANIALILGLTALVRPVAMKSGILRQELPLLAGVTLLAGWQIRDGDVTRDEALVLLGLFAAWMAWTVLQCLRQRTDPVGAAMEERLAGPSRPFHRILFQLLVGLVLLIASSRLLVWGAVAMAVGFGVSDLLIGLTIVAVGTSLPELASALAAARKGKHDLVLGNVLGSNLFNTLAVVGIAGVIHPMSAGPDVFSRDYPVMALLTFSLFVVGYGWRGRGLGRVNRWEGAVLLAMYLGYMAFLLTRFLN